jgi:hypothetical protein
VPLRSCSQISAVDPCESRPWGVASERPEIDVGTARETGATLFYSPEQLDDANPGVENQRNLYLADDGGVQYVTTFDPGTGAVRYNLSPDGRHLAFVTTARLSSYDNVAAPNGECEEIDSAPGLPGVPCREVYSFDADSGALRCVSCNPSGAAPMGDAIASAGGRFMADDGRVFFSTRDALVPRDTDGLYSVYEYVAGRPQLISSGTSAADRSPGLFNVAGLGPYWDPVYTGLEAVSADGVDVFFSTFDSLVPEDNNGQFVKIYVARTSGGFATSVPPLPCEAADECHGPASASPPEVEVGSGADLASGGNLSSEKQNKRAKRRAKRRARKRRKLENRARRNRWRSVARAQRVTPRGGAGGRTR